MVCQVCGSQPEIMVVVKGKVFCFSCLVEKYPDVASEIVKYLTEFKGVRVS